MSARGQDADPPRTPRAAVRIAIDQLTTEARAAKREGRLTRTEADFAESFDHETDPHELGRQIMRRQDRDPFIDAYIRWQLTSFEIILPEVADRRFEKFLGELPDFAENPRADEVVLALIQRWRETLEQREGAQLTEDEAAGVNRELNTLSEAHTRASRFSDPARKLRDWMIEKLEENGGLRVHQARLELCNSLIEAGWPVSDVKRQILDGLEASHRDASLTAEHRRTLARQMAQLANARRAILQTARVINNRLEFTINETAVYDFEVNAWIRAMRR